MKYDSDKYFEQVQKKDKHIQGLGIQDRIEQRLVRIEMLMLYLKDVTEANQASIIPKADVEFEKGPAGS
jgi:hypothetical protein